MLSQTAHEIVTVRTALLPEYEQQYRLYEPIEMSHRARTGVVVPGTPVLQMSFPGGFRQLYFLHS